MATLTGQTIAASYEQILHVDRDGGGNTSTLVNIKDGDNGTTFCASMTDASTAKAILSIDGSHANGTALYIDNSAGDGDVSLEWQLSGTTTWLMGIEDGDSDSLKICHDSTMGTDERLSFLTASTVFNEDSGDIDFRVESNTGTHAIFVDAGTPEVVINDDSIDMNFRVEGNGEANLLFCDAGNDRVGIGTDAPAYNFVVKGSDVPYMALLYNQVDADIDDDETLGGLLFQGGDASIGSGKTAASIIAKADANWTVHDNRAPGRLEFNTQDDSDSTTLGSPRMVIDEGGKVGIGTSSPNATLEVASASAGIEISRYDTTDANFPTLDFRKSGNATVGSHTVVAADEKLGALRWFGSDGDSFSEAAYILAVASGTINDGDVPSELRFATTASGGTDADPTVRMTIDDDGNVGIGAASPDNLLEVIGNDAGNYIAKFKNEGDATSRYGIAIYCGKYDASGTNHAVKIFDGDDDAIGGITFSGATVTYGAFTANHDIELPSADNSSGYDYGTLVETTEIFYKQKNGADTERGILYKVQKSSSAYSKSILGAYAGKYDDEDNMHQVYVLGDGHILCCNEKGNISVGDGICSSSIAGLGMKADTTCMIIGIAQKDISFSGSESKLVPVQYQLTQWTPWDE